MGIKTDLDILNEHRKALKDFAQRLLDMEFRETIEEDPSLEIITLSAAVAAMAHVWRRHKLGFMLGDKK